MDDILLAGKHKNSVLKCFADLKTALKISGLQIAPKNVQLQDPYTYLGFQINGPKVINKRQLLQWII